MNETLCGDGLSRICPLFSQGGGLGGFIGVLLVLEVSAEFEEKEVPVLVAGESIVEAVAGGVVEIAEVEGFAEDLTGFFVSCHLDATHLHDVDFRYDFP